MLPPWFFHYLKPIPMASKTTPATQPAAPEAPEKVYLRSEELGETRPFTPAHAKALLAYQQEKGQHLWQPAEAPAAGE